ncbi:MAG: YIP1 family protein [Deltaproteobacteria bacterium]|nr:YIP1 family protein [Deltaproteobacteria bacterium]
MKMNLLDRVKNILLKPKQEWEVIAGETTTTADLYKNYIIILAAIGPVASIIGMSLVGVSASFMGSFRVPIATSVSSAVVSYVLGLAGVYIIALIIDYLAPTFSAEKNMNQALKLAAYSFTASWVAGIFVIIPALAILSILGLYSIYLIYTGLPVLMKAPAEKSVGYTVAVIIASIIIFFIISWIPRAFISYPTPGMHMRGFTNEAPQELKEAARQMQAAATKMQESVAKMPQADQTNEEQSEEMQEATKQMQEAIAKLPKNVQMTEEQMKQMQEASKRMQEAMAKQAARENK